MTDTTRYVIRRPSGACLTTAGGSYSWATVTLAVPVVTDRATAELLADRYGGTPEVAP